MLRSSSFANPSFRFQHVQLMQLKQRPEPRPCWISRQLSAFVGIVDRGGLVDRSLDLKSLTCIEKIAKQSKRFPGV